LFSVENGSLLEERHAAKYNLDGELSEPCVGSKRRELVGGIAFRVVGDVGVYRSERGEPSLQLARTNDELLTILNELRHSDEIYQSEQLPSISDEHSIIVWYTGSISGGQTATVNSLVRANDELVVSTTLNFGYSPPWMTWHIVLVEVPNSAIEGVESLVLQSVSNNHTEGMS
jgi:hypothetical protein